VQIGGKAAIVTGAAWGIGRAIATALAAEGASVVVADLDEEAGSKVAAELEGATFVRADVSSEDDVPRLIARAGGVDILVNNACQGKPPPYFPDTPVTEWSSVLDVCLRGTMLCTYYAVAKMRGRGGAIVNISSSAGLGDHPHVFREYATAKAAVIRLTQCLGPLAEEGIRVNCVAPDWTATERVLERFEPDARNGFGRRPPERLLEPAEVAGAVLDLIRDDSLAGRTLVLRGGEPTHLLPDDRWE